MFCFSIDMTLNDNGTCGFDLLNSEPITNPDFKLEYFILNVITNLFVEGGLGRGEAKHWRGVA